MKISVVITTYNGEPYLTEQLESIRKQTLQPDEVLIFDDCSNNKTVSLIENFISTYNLDTWKLYINKSNIGWKRNFINGFDKAAGDLIFPCDQDDIWELDKVESMARIMDENEKIFLLASNYKPFYQGEKSEQLPKK